jgi:glycosyl transferase family 2
MLNAVRVDAKPIPDVTEIRLFGKIRNEINRLPFFLSYHRNLGVDRFFIVDNDSTDGSREFLSGEPDCHVFLTKENMATSRAGMNWIEPLLARYGLDRWCIVADADELLAYPKCETVSLPEFCAGLGRLGTNALPCIMLDMYPAGDINQLAYAPGQSFIEACPFFDRDGYRWISNGPGGPTIVGGPRVRMFYPELLDRRLSTRMRRRFLYHVGQFVSLASPVRGPMLSKVPLVLWSTGMAFGSAAHYLSGARLASGNGALLHFKFLAEFGDRVREELVRKAYFRGGEEYERYYARLGAGAAMDFTCAASVRYRGTGQLAALGLIREPRGEPARVSMGSLAKTGS